MKNVKFYACQSCGNVMTSTGATSISCCGRILEPLLPTSENDEHEITIHDIEEDYFVTMMHEMSRDHYISFVAYVSYDRVTLIKLYPEQPAEVRFPTMYGGTLYMYCTRHGLRKYEKNKLGSKRVS